MIWANYRPVAMHAITWGDFELGRKDFFFEKKKQKTFSHLSRWLFQQRGTELIEVFCFFFSKKKRFSSPVDATAPARS
jgi:hypothetical protein